MKRTERHHLKENELLATVERVRDWVEAHQKQVTVGAIVAVVLVAAGLGYSALRRQGESQGVALLAEAMVALNAQVVPAGVSGGEADLPAAASLGATGSFATEEAKLNAALPKLQAAADAYPDSKAGITARYHLAGALASLGRYDDALREFDDVIARAGTSSLYGRMARLGRADTLADAGRTDEALAAWTAMTQTEAAAFPVDAVLMQMARTYVLAGDVESARRTLTQIVDEHPDSIYAPEARAELELL